MAEGMLEELKLRSRQPSPSHSYFIAQHWEGADGMHPDNAMRTKHGWLRLLKRHLSLSPHMAIWLWMDYVSVPTQDAEKRRMGLRSTLYYCQVDSPS